MVVAAAAYVIVKPFLDQILGRAGRARGPEAARRLAPLASRRTPRPRRTRRRARCAARPPPRRAGPARSSCPRSAGIVPQRRSSAASIAASPSRVASTRSKAVGVPPRWMWPSTVARVSKPVRCSISRSSSCPIPPRRSWPNSSLSPLTISIVPSCGMRALGDDDDREVAPARVAAADQAAHLVDVERPLGDQDHVGAAGEPGVERDPARVAAHHLDDHHAVVALGRRVQAVDRVGGDLHGGVEAEGHVGAAEVVVDRLRHARAPAGRARRAAGRRRRACPRRRSRSARRG